MIGIWHIRHFFYTFILPSHHMNLRLALENAHTLVQRTDIFSHKFSTKVSLMLDNPFLVLSLCKLNQIRLSSRLAQNHQQNCLFPSGKALFFFWSHPRCFGPLGKFQHNIKISIKMARVFRLTVSCDYGKRQHQLQNSWRHNLFNKQLQYTDCPISYAVKITRHWNLVN